MSSNPDNPIKLSILSSPTHLPVVRAAVEKTCELVGFDSETAASVVLSVDEALTNIIRHAYQGAEDKPIEVELVPIDRKPGGLRISLRDYGRPIDVDRIKPRDLSHVRPGGLGLHIMAECMDRVEYDTVEGGGTLLMMVKNLPSDRKGG